jgi:hypothetical protein
MLESKGSHDWTIEDEDVASKARVGENDTTAIR